MPAKRKTTTAVAVAGSSAVAVGNGAAVAQAGKKGHHTVRLQPHPRRRDLVMVSIDGSPAFAVRRDKLNRFGHVQNRALVALSRPTENAVAIATMHFDDWRGAVAAALKESLEGRQA
jgi:hypothetical protein